MNTVSSCPTTTIADYTSTKDSIPPEPLPPRKIKETEAVPQHIPYSTITNNTNLVNTSPMKTPSVKQVNIYSEFSFNSENQPKLYASKTIQMESKESAVVAFTIRAVLTVKKKAERVTVEENQMENVVSESLKINKETENLALEESNNIETNETDLINTEINKESTSIFEVKNEEFTTQPIDEEIAIKNELNKNQEELLETNEEVVKPKKKRGPKPSAEKQKKALTPRKRKKSSVMTDRFDSEGDLEDQDFTINNNSGKRR